MRISDWSSDVCSSDLPARRGPLSRRNPSDPATPANKARIDPFGLQPDPALAEYRAVRGGCRTGWGFSALFRRPILLAVLGLAVLLLHSPPAAAPPGAPGLPDLPLTETGRAREGRVEGKGVSVR